MPVAPGCSLAASHCLARPVVIATRGRQASWAAAGSHIAKRLRVHDLRQRRQPAPLAAAATAAMAADEAPPAGSSGSMETVTTIFCVPQCRLQPGEHLRVVGSCTELGSWAMHAAPSLDWQDGDLWTTEQALAPGSHEFKLVIVREEDGSAQWEDGPNRSLPVPHLVGVAAMAAAPLAVTCHWGDPAATLVAADPAQLQAAADAAAARVLGLQQQKQQLAKKVTSLEQEVQKSEVAIAGREREVEQLVAEQQEHLEHATAVTCAASLVPDLAVDTAAAAIGASPSAPGTQAAIEVEMPVLAAAAAESVTTARFTHQVFSSTYDEAMIDETAEQELEHLNQTHAEAMAIEQSQPQEPVGSKEEAAMAPAAMEVVEEEAAASVPVEATCVVLAAAQQLRQKKVKQQKRSDKKQQQQQEVQAVEAAQPMADTVEAAAAAAPAVEEPAAAATAEVAVPTSAGLPPATAAAAPDPDATGEGPATMDGVAIEAGADGSLCFSFAVPVASSSSDEEEPSAAKLAEQRLVSLLPPKAAASLQQRLRAMASNNFNSSSMQVPLEAPSAEGRQASHLVPSARSGAMLGSPVQPSAASSGDWSQQPPPQPKKTKQKQLRAGHVSLPMADEPPTASDMAAEGALPPLAPSPVPVAAGQQQGEVLRLFSTPDAGVLLEGRGGAADGYTAITMRPSLPIATAWLVLASIYGSGNVLWGVGRTALPPLARRPADLAFWLLFTTALVVPFWK